MYEFIHELIYNHTWTMIKTNDETCDKMLRYIDIS